MKLILGILGAFLLVCILIVIFAMGVQGAPNDQAQPPAYTPPVAKPVSTNNRCGPDHGGTKCPTGSCCINEGVCIGGGVLGGNMCPGGMYSDYDGDISPLY